MKRYDLILGTVVPKTTGQLVEHSDVQKYTDKIVDYLSASCCLDALSDLYEIIEQEGFEVNND